MQTGNWNESANAGVFYRNLNNYRSNDNNNNGFRAADYTSIPDTTEVDTGDIGITSPASAKYAVDLTELYSNPTLELIAREEVLYQAFLNARKGKRNKKAIYEFENNLAFNLKELRERLLTNKYEPDEPRVFNITEPKPRVVAAPSFRDSVVQHAIYMVVYPLFDKGFIHDNYGCRKEKGAHRASDAVQTMMRRSEKGSYFLQMDIKKYYYNIVHSVLRTRLARKIKDENLLDLMIRFAGDIFKGVGLFIGNLLSQLYGLVYMDWTDHFCKRVLRVKNYVRYVDDFVIIGVTKEKAQLLLIKIETFLKEELKLELSKWLIAPVRKGINFVGFRTWRSTRYIRKRSMHNFSKALKRNKANSLISIMGNAKRTATFAYFKFKLKEHNDLQMQNILRIWR